jgi:long-chain acyl-CoA synthetase
MHFPENASTVLNDLREVRPEIVFATPRFWEKLAADVELFMREAIAPAQWAFRWARAHATAWPARAVLRNVRASLGLRDARYAVTGAASVSAEMLAWYAALGTAIVETYGLAETTGPVTLTQDVEVRVEGDGHVLVRGAMLAAGYRGPDAPLHVDADGWLATGDCGSIEHGTLRIVNRRADLIVNRHGVIAPGSIESRLRFSPYVYDVVVVGHGREYLTCLVMIDGDGLTAITRDLALEEMTFPELIRTPGVRGVLQEEINRVNAALRAEDHIRDFRVIDRVIVAGDGELSPTLRLHRQIAAVTYRALIEEMY